MLKKLFASPNRLWEYVTKIILSLILADAAYILAIVQKMTEDTSLAAERYHTVPVMAEHILAAVVVYLIGMVLISKSVKE